MTPPALHDQTLNRLFDLRGRVAFVPGGYGGIGEAIAWGLDRGVETTGVLVSDPAFAGSDTLATASSAAGRTSFPDSAARMFDAVPSSARA